MSRTILAALALLVLTGCAHLPRAIRAPLPSELDARDALLAAWTDAGREVPEGWVSRRVDVYEADQATITTWCKSPQGRPVMACSNTIQRRPGAPASIVIYISESARGRVHHSLIIHELAHQLRVAWVIAAAGGPEYLERLHAGESPACLISHPADFLSSRSCTEDRCPHHCDAELWTEIVHDALRRWEAP